MRVLGISGSLRRGSYNTALLRHAGALFEAAGAEFGIYHGLRDIPAYDEDYDTGKLPRPLRESARRSGMPTLCSSSPRVQLLDPRCAEERS
jgi:chromate reductase